MFAMLFRLSSSLIVRVLFLIILLVSFFACLAPFGVVLRFCTSRHDDSSWSLVVIVLSLGCSFCVVAALPVLEFVR